MKLLRLFPAWLLRQKDGPVVGIELRPRVFPGFQVVALTGAWTRPVSRAAAAIQQGVGPGPA